MSYNPNSEAEDDALHLQPHIAEVDKQAQSQTFRLEALRTVDLIQNPDSLQFNQHTSLDHRSTAYSPTTTPS
jgi:hypothetical protein